ncbi:MAG: alpha/beta hydrolase [Pseudomonadota bacterium]
MADDIHSMDPQQANLLRRYAGAKPEAPDWFSEAVNTPYTEHFVTVKDAKIRYQTWGARGKPGLLLSHGNGAHAHWYDFIAPAFAEDYFVVAMTFSGMGDSDWRERYSFETFTAEQIAVCQDAGLFDGGAKPVIVAHSFGGFITLNTARLHADRLAGVVIVDSGLRKPDEEWQGPPRKVRGNRAYASLNAALARFRLAPPQPCENHYIVDYIARHSLKEIENQAGQKGWNWKFDPHLLLNFDFERISDKLLDRVEYRLGFMRGADSVLVTDETWAYMRTLHDDMDMVSIPDAQHHVMLDQPLAFIDAVKAQLNAWKY